MEIDAYKLASRFLGVREVPGASSNPLVLAMLELDSKWPQDDEVSWCSAFVNWVAWLLDVPRSKSLAARSWLGVGATIELGAAQVGFDVVVLSRGPAPQPGPGVLDAPGHVGFYAGMTPEGRVRLLGGNQGDAVTLESFDTARVLGVRRLA